jgi:Ca2+-binding EF-hand superfamily protein
MDGLQRKKLQRLFHLLDVNRDGYLQEMDYVRIGDQVARLHGLVANSAEYQQMRARMHDYWHSLLARAAISDSQISVDEWLVSMETNSESLQEARARMVGLAAVLLDRNGDGKITVDDYQLLFHQLGHDLDKVQTVFARLDGDRDGQIAQEELARLVNEFLYSTDTSAPGNWLLGIL